MLRCSRCRQDKAETEFYEAKHRGAAKRRLFDYYCKACRRNNTKHADTNEHGKVAIRHLMQLPEDSQREIANWLLSRARAYDQAMFLEPRQYELTL